MKKILVPTDFSGNAGHALEVAATLAAKYKATLVLLHANTQAIYAPPLAEYGNSVSFDMMDYAAAAAEELYGLKKELTADPEFASLDIETIVEEGFLYSTIERIAKTSAIDLIVMGTKGATGALEFFVGSNTEKVIRVSPCPVLAVPNGATGALDIKTIVLPTTLRPDQGKVFNQLAEWQKKFHFEVKVLYLNNPGGFKDDEAIHAATDQMAEKAGLKKTSAFVSANTFDEEAAILQFARLNKADMIVMGTHQRQGLSHMLFGSLTEDTANHASVPVLSIPI